MAEDEKRKLYRLIVTRTSEWVLLDRMRVHGFWPAGEPLPQDPPEEAEERKNLEARLAQLRQQSSPGVDPEKALADERKRRWAESKKKRAERKLQRKAEQKKRRERWAAHKAGAVVHAGEGVSGWLGTAGDAAELAASLGISLSRLRWLTYHRQVVALVHYHRYQILKRSGGQRNISAPKPDLARAQRWILDNILAPLETEPQAHGFVPQRSIVSNASPHVRKLIVANLDLKDFFPSVTFFRVRGLFGKLGHSPQVATLLALLCTEPPRVEAEVQGKVLHVAVGERRLPQGACTSPAITNLICRRLDRRLAGLARRMDFEYTRYADDLTFSGDHPDRIGRLLGFARKIIAGEGFAENPEKTRIMRSGRRQQVTGVVVNERLSISRQERRKLRAILHNAARFGLESQNRENVPSFADYLRGMVAYYHMVDPAGAQPLWAALRRVWP